MRLAIVLALTTAGCFTKPDRPTVGDDAKSGDAPSSGLVPRLIGNAFLDGSGVGTGGMDKSGFAISTQNIVDNDLVLFIASIDNGSNTFWPDPIATGFQQISQNFYGNDGETFVVAWKIASHEPPSYTGTYEVGTATSGAATISLVAISGADPNTPINASHTSYTPAGAPGTLMPTGSSAGVTTTVPGCTLVYASGADWQMVDGSNTAQPPPGFTPLTSVGDRGEGDGTTVSWDWTSQQVAYKSDAALGISGIISGSLTGTHIALPWTVVVAIAPAP